MGHERPTNINQMASTKDVGIPLPGRRAPEALPKPQRRKREKGISRGVGRALITGAALAALGGAGYVTYQEIPAIHKSVNTLGEKIAERWNSLFGGQTIEERFPIKLDQSSFTSVSETEQENLWKNTKTLDLENHTFTTGFPFDQATIDRNPDLRMDQQFDGDLLPPFIDGAKLKQEGVKNVTYYTGLQKGEEFKLFYDSEKFDASVILLWKAGITQGTGTDLFTPAYAVYRVKFRNKTTGEVINKSIAGLYAEPLIQTNPLPKDHGDVYEDGTPVESGEPIMKTTTDLQDWDGTNQILPGQKGQFMVGTAYMQQEPMAGIPLTNKNLATSNGDIATQ